MLSEQLVTSEDHKKGGRKPKPRGKAKGGRPRNNEQRWTHL